MKLPEDKKERMKIIVIILIGVAVVGYLLVAFVIIPLMNQNKAAKEEIVEKRAAVEQAEREIKLMEKDRVLNSNALHTTKSVSDRFFLRPRLGNFILSAREIVEQHAKTVEITLQPNDIREVGIADIIAAPSSKQDIVVRTYTAHVTTRIGYNQLLAFLKEIETSNPLVVVSSVCIEGIPDRPEEHNTQFDVQWPIWSDQEMPAKLEAQIKANETPGGAKK